MRKEIDYPREGYFFKGRLLNGNVFSSDSTGKYGFKDWDNCINAMTKYISEHRKELDYIEGPFIGIYD